MCLCIQFGDSGHVLKVLKQLLCVDGIVYMLQEIYGLENKSKQEENNSVSTLVKQMNGLCKNASIYIAGLYNQEFIIKRLLL